MTEIYVLALSDHNISKLAGQIFYVKNRDLFTSVVKKYISNELSSLIYELTERKPIIIPIIMELDNM